MLQGQLQVIAPRKVLTFDLTRQDVGKKQTAENISITLLAVDKNSAQIEMSNSADLPADVSASALNPLLVQARDTTGQFLSSSGSINENAEHIAFYEKQLAELQKQQVWSETFEGQLKEQQQIFERQQARHYTQVYFNGTIDTLEVSVFDFSGATVTRKDLKLPVRKFDRNTTEKAIQSLSLPVVVYDDQALNWLKDATLDEQTLKKRITINQSVEDPSAARIEFEHPKGFNDELLGSSFHAGGSPVTFFTQGDDGKRGDPIELPAEAYEVDPLRATIIYDLNLFAQTPAYAIGSMPLFLARIEKKSLAAGQLPKGLELKGNALMVDQKLFPAQDWRFYAKDDSGNYLKEILAVSHGAVPDEPALVDVHYFYGQPSQLETFQRTDLTTVEYGFEVKLDTAHTENLSSNGPGVRGVTKSRWDDNAHR
jgi:hypothetical protein